MTKWLLSSAAIIALIAIPIVRSGAYPGSGGGHSGGHSSGGHSSGGNFGGGNTGGNHSNFTPGSGNNHPSNGNGQTSNGNNHPSNGNGHPSNGNGHPMAKNHSPTPNGSSKNLSKNSSGKNHSGNSNSFGKGKNGSGHYQYTHHHGGPWDHNEWAHAWNRHWYHTQFIWWNGGWIWWDPDVSDWVPYVEGQYIPEDYYVQGDEPPAAGGPAIRIINPPDSQSTINYAINDYDYQIEPGSQQDLPADQQWVIAFDRGENDGTAQYTLATGDYTFGPSDHGWELYHTSGAAQD